MSNINIMNDFQSKLWDELIKLCDGTDKDSFFFKDHERDGRTYRIFAHMLVSYSDFLLPSALKARGTMFLLNSDGTPNSLAALPVDKFFNLYENPFTENIDLSEVERIMVKEDGSLISTFLHKNSVGFKSKGSLASDQAIDAEAHFASYSEEVKETFLFLVDNDYTINMEWVAPHNRIVLGYREPELIILNIRNNLTGEYLDLGSTVVDDIRHMFVPTVECDDSTVFVNNIPKMENIEGFVMVMSDGQMIKVKTEWYLARHRARDSINHPKRLFKAIIGQEIDDITVLFKDDPEAIRTIDEMTALVQPKFNHMIKVVEAFHKDNLALSRKDYAIKAKGLDDRLMGLYMSEWLGNTQDYVGFAKKNFDMFIGELL